MKGGFYFHPSDQDQSPVTPAMKKPLECVLSTYSNSETAVVARVHNLPTGYFGYTKLIAKSHCIR